MRMSVNHGLPRSALLLTLCVSLAACKEDAKPKKVDPDQPLVQRPRRPEPDPESPFTNPAKDPPTGREGEQLPDAELEKALATAKEAADGGRVAVATQALLECANKTPPSARCDGEVGLLLADVDRRKAEANYYLAEAARFDDPKASADLYGRISEELRKRGLFEDAVSAAELALAREATSARHVSLSRVLQSMPDQLARAAQEMGEAFALEPENYQLLYEQATILGQMPSAEANTQAADLFEQYIEKASPPDERVQATKVRIAELRAIAKRIAREEKAAQKAEKKKSG
jgi:hypothetical protein